MKKKNGKALSGKGFYVALSLSVAMVGAACYFAYTQTGEDFTDEAEIQYSRTTTAPQREAANIVTGVTKPVRITTSAPKVTRTYTTSVTRPVTTEAEKTAAEQTAEAAADKPSDSGDMQMPLEGEVMNEFSGGELVRSKTTGAWQTHNGVDIKAELGDSVTACASGRVSSVDKDPLWGVTVTIDHGNGIVTKYCGLNSDSAVQAGQEVSRGEEIGTVGNTADIESSEECHLHLEVMKNGAYADPMEMM